jgi:hypothetical protein
MRGKKKKLTKELETEVKELIANSGQSEEDIHTDYNTYRALKKRIDNPDSCHYDDNIPQMKDLHDVYLLGMSIHNRQNKINAARKVAATAAPPLLPPPPPPPSPPLPLPHPMLQIPPYLHMPLQWIHLHLL